MTPILFDSTTTDFTTNGLGRLEAISCRVTEELNGKYELDLTYPGNGRHAANLTTSNIIGVVPYDGGTMQAFRIYKVGKTMDGRIVANARHISYQLNWIPVMPHEYSSLQDCLEKLKTYSVVENPFEFWTDKTVISGGSFKEPLSCRERLGGVTGSILQKYGGQYEWDNWTVKLWKRRGHDNGVRISYGKNLVDARQEANIERTYTGICPFYTDENVGTITLPEKYIMADTAANFPYPRIKTVDFSSDYEVPPTIEELRARAEKYITDNRIGHPAVSVDADFVALWQTEEYKTIAPLERVQLGDTVTVYFEKLGIDESAQVVGYEYDVLRERYRKIQIGTIKSTFSRTIVGQGQAIEETAENLETSIRKNTAWLTRGDGYVVAVKRPDGSWKELCFLDSPDIETATKVLRINENGIGFSDEGINGDYAQSWTLDGVLSLGGLNNRYGEFILLDADGNAVAYMSKDGVYYEDYDGDGTVRSMSTLDGYGFSANETDTNAMVGISPGTVEVVDEDGYEGHLTGTELSVGGVIAAGGNIQAETEVLAGRGFTAQNLQGLNVIAELPGVTLTFTGGILTNAEETEIPEPDEPIEEEEE